MSSVGAVTETVVGLLRQQIGVAGLGVDNLLSAEVVLAGGEVVTADPQHEAEGMSDLGEDPVVNPVLCPGQPACMV
jgi:FAD/FMN-containing dehydrogenase